MGHVVFLENRMRIGFLWIFVLAVGLCGQDTKLDRPGLNQLQPKEFDQFLRKGLQPQARKMLDRPEAEANNECSIPLLEYGVPHPEQYTIRRLPVRSSPDPMAKAMPVCKR